MKPLIILILILSTSQAHANGQKFPEGFIQDAHDERLRAASLNGGNSTAGSFEGRLTRATSRERVQIAVRVAHQSTRAIDGDLPVVTLAEQRDFSQRVYRITELGIRR